MKKILLAIVFATFAFGAVAQKNGGTNYGATYTKLYKAYVQKPNDVATLVAMADFYADSLNPMRNLSLAFKYIRQAEDNYVAMVEDNAHYRDVSKLLRKKITITSVREKRQTIHDAVKIRLQGNELVSESELAMYADLMSGDAAICRLVDRRRMQSLYEELCLSNSLDDLYAFMTKYPGTAEAEHLDTLMGGLAAPTIETFTTEKAIDSMVHRYPESKCIVRLANKQRGSMAFESVRKLDNIEAYQAYLAQYPSSSHYVEVLERMEALIENEYQSLSTAKDYADFISAHSENPLADEAMEQLHMLILEKQDVAAAKLYLQRFQLDAQYNDIFRQFYEWHAAEGNRQPIEEFAKDYPNFPFQQALKSDLGEGLKIDAVNLMDRFTESEFEQYASYVYHLTGKKASFVALQRTLQQMIAQQKWSDALNRMDYFGLSFETDCIEECNELRQILAAASNPNKARTTEVIPGYNMLNATLHPDGKRLFYTKKSGGRSSICAAQLANAKNYKWKSTGELHFCNDENTNLTFYSLYDNGTKMLVGKEGDIWIAQYEDTAWRLAELPPYPLNTDYTETDAYMVPDGSGMLLASDRPNGHNFQRSGAYFHGDTALASDLYFVPLTLQGWGTPINLGLPVNSAYSERCPVLSRNLKTLFFITDAHGLGYGDIYMTTRTNAEDWTHWSTPVNVGKEINTAMNEASISLSADERRMFICSNNANDRYACYSTATWHSTASNTYSVQVDASVVPSDIKELYLVEIGNQHVVKTLQHPTDSLLTFTLYADHQYAIAAKTDGFFTPTLMLDRKATEPAVLRASTLYYLSDLATLVPLPLVSFEHASAKLRPLSTLELEVVADFLHYHPDARIEIHSNVKGSDDQQCYNLSHQRGETIRTWLSNHGIDPSRISISAFGNVNFKSGENPSETALLFHTR